LEDPSRNNQQFRQGIFAAVLIVLVVGGSLGIGTAGGSGDIGTPELTMIQGPTIAQVTVNSGTVSGFTTITYAPAFPTIPTLTITSQTQILGLQSNAYNQLPFQSGTELNWPNMPSALTEIYGDANGDHRIATNWIASTGFRFGVNCVTASNMAGAYLTVQYSANSGSTWTELNTAQRFIIDNTQCPSSFPGASVFFANTAYSTIPAPALINPVLFRIIGVGGGGIGDTPKFSELWLEWQFPTSNSGNWRSCNALANCGTQPNTGASQFIIEVYFPIPVTIQQTFRFTWSAGLPA